MKAGESNYTELGVEVGLLGALLWAGWGIALVLRLARPRESTEADWFAPAVAVTLAATLALAVQTDVIGDPWIAYVVWSLAGLAVARRATVQA